MSIGARLRVAIESQHLSLADFARATGIAYRTIQAYLADQREPNAAAMQAICVHSYIDLHWLLTGRGEILRAPDTARAPPITDPREQALIERWRALDETSRVLVEAIALQAWRLQVLEHRLAHPTAADPESSSKP